MNENDLIEFSKIPGYKNLLSDFEIGQFQALISLPRSVRLPFISSIQKDLQRTILFVTSKSDRLLSMFEEFSFWENKVKHHIFSEPAPLFYERSSWSSEIRFERLDTLTDVVQFHLPGKRTAYNPSVIFTSVKSLMTKTMPRRDFIKNSFSLNLNDKIIINELIQRLLKIGYAPVEIVVSGGQFSRRGGILDIWPTNFNNPVRIEYFGDEIDTLRIFDPASQRSIEKIKSVYIPPAMEVLQVLDEANEDGKGDEISEFSIPIVFQFAGTLIDYLPKNSIIVLDNAASLQVTAEEIEAQSLRTKNDNEDLGLIPHNYPAPYFSWSELIDEMSQYNSIDLGFPLGESGHQISDAFAPSPRFGSRLDEFFSFINENIEHTKHVFIVSKQVNRIKEVQGESKLHRSGQEEKLIYIEGSLTAGWKTQYPDGSDTYLFSDNELFGWELPRPRRQKQISSSSPELYFSDLKADDFVVHIDYGIAKYFGLVNRSIEGISRDFLLLKYADDDELFVPVHQADRISHYVGPDNRQPKLSKLGSTDWKNKRDRTKHAVREIAYDLLELYAKRQTVKGFAFSKDNDWQAELEAGFPYQETKDQAQAIEEVKSDMERDRPMDRLLCGDVGYGKTEVALRSAFKSVMNNKQVAMLVPTTVLAQQHYETFKSRLSPFPVQIEMLSRFRTPSEQAKILLQLEEGEIDVVIGTHRLLQSDVIFKDLGLLIIDEEQRFGVAHKEFFKKMRQEIDVLTLTATPIPRTLYMALSGIRDISVINSPPAERLPVQTFTGSFDENVVRKAIIREIDRGGQVFYVHNRVQTIRTVANHLKKIVPEAKIGIAHGQMREKNLADVMTVFTAGKIDILLSTSIIESGLDIPNANTLILDRADTFGLAQLYQLRGRIGRGSSRAYAYFFHHNKNLPTPEGLERLEIIAENSQLGAGYSIAMRDLEMRGAGDLLGAMQHGYIASVGFHLYTRLLAEVIQGLKDGQGFKIKVERVMAVKPIRPLVNVELPISVHIPCKYIGDNSLRLQLYRRVAEIEDEENISSVIEEFEDRFGPPPEEVINLLFQIRVKLKAEKCGFNSISIEGNQLIFRYPPFSEKNKQRELIDLGKSIRRGRNAYWIPLDGKLDWRIRIMRILDDLLLRMKEA
ncbi:MAG: transcription-repair coupling factor [Pelolinea sp.]|nr:transcription-repair coupling factor [Pelolinea sp.]